MNKKIYSFSLSPDIKAELKQLRLTDEFFRHSESQIIEELIHWKYTLLISLRDE